MKKQKAKITADRAEQLKKSNVRAGKSKASEIMRKVQNKEVKDGTIKIGKSGKTYNVYDAKSGTWKRGIVMGANMPKPKTAKPKRYGVSSYVTDRDAKPFPHKQGVNTTLGSEGPKPRITKRSATRVPPSRRGEGYAGSKNSRYSISGKRITMRSR